MDVNQKTIGLLLSLIGAVGAIVSIPIMFLIQQSPVMEFYHYALIFLMPVFVVILVVGIYLYLRPQEVKLKTIVKATRIEKILTADERRVIDFLRGKKSVSQADIRKGLDIPRATLSVLLSRMEKRKLIKKEKIGKTNYVTPMKGF